MTNYEKSQQLKAERDEYIKQQRMLAESLSDAEFMMVVRSMVECVEDYGKQINKLHLMPANEWDVEYEPSMIELMTL